MQKYDWCWAHLTIFFFFSFWHMGNTGYIPISDLPKWITIEFELWTLRSRKKPIQYNTLEKYSRKLFNCTIMYPNNNNNKKTDTDSRIKNNNCAPNHQNVMNEKRPASGKEKNEVSKSSMLKATIKYSPVRDLHSSRRVRKKICCY